MNKSETEEYMNDLTIEIIETIGNEPAKNVATACTAAIVFMMPRMPKHERKQIALVLQDIVRTIGRGKGGHITDFKH